jgi:predicted small secreted protein
MKKLLIIMAMGMMIFNLTACQTMKGLGEDVEDAGEWVQKKAS